MTASTTSDTIIATSAAGGLPVQAPVVDTHSHIFVQGLPLAPVRRYAPHYNATDDDYLAQLDANSVRYGVLVQPSFLGTDNSYMLGALARRPDRFRGVAVVDPTISPASLQEMHYAGVVGIRLNLKGLALPDLTSTEWQTTLAWLRDHDWHVEVHRVAADLPTLLDPLLHAGVRVVVDHFGTPDPALGASDPGFRYLCGTASSGRVWVKVAAVYRLADEGGLEMCRELTEDLLDSFGAEQLVWGSDWPHTTYEDAVSFGKTRAVIANLIPDVDTRTQIESASALELFHFPTPEETR